MIVDKPEETLNGGYNGLYAEVVTFDTYRLKELKFIPDIIFDLGANVGIFTRFARSLFPDALIVCVEPDAENFAHLVKFTNHSNTIFINKAIGYPGQVGVWKRVGVPNGAHESYLSNGIGMYEVIESGEQVEVVNVETVTVEDLLKEYVKPGMKSLLKLDIELNEIVVWNDLYSMVAIEGIDYFTGEAHWTMLTGQVASESKERTLKALHSFNETHTVEIESTSFWLTKYRTEW
jgi:FkbM family methyltransferase